MPGDTKAKHPRGLGITFTEEDHSYVDEYGVEYTSGTTLVHRGFEAFDAQRAAEAKSAKTGVPASEYLREWDAKREEASRNGTRMHENCENQILGRYDKLHAPQDDAERVEFRAAWGEVERIRAGGFERLEPEKIIFSPRFRVSGSIDLLCTRGGGRYLILDWKRVKGIEYGGFRGKTGTHIATRHLADCNFVHYSLQLSIYEQILRLEGYIEPDAEVDKWLNVYCGSKGVFEHVHCADLRWEALALMAWNVTCDGLEDVPF